MLVEEYNLLKKVSWKELEKLLKGLEYEYVLLGGWAVHLNINESFFEDKRRDYIGSKDIDIGIRSKDFEIWNEYLKRKGFIPINFRYFKIFHVETLKEINEKESIKYPLHDIFKLYVDLIFDRERKMSVMFFYDPLIKVSLDKKLYLKKEGIKIEIPEILFVQKINSISGRNVEKKIKDFLDLTMLILYSDLNEDILKDLVDFIKNKEIKITPEILEELKFLGYSEDDILEILRVEKIFLERFGIKIVR